MRMEAPRAFLPPPTGFEYSATSANRGEAQRAMMRVRAKSGLRGVCMATRNFASTIAFARAAMAELLVSPGAATCAACPGTGTGRFAVATLVLLRERRQELPRRR